MAALTREPHPAWAWCCLHCGGPLAGLEGGLACAACGRRYPVLAGIPILVREPDRYLRAERATLTQALEDAGRSHENLDDLARAAGLPEASRSRHRDVIGAEIARAALLLELLDAAAAMPAGEDGTALYTQPTGWAVDALLPYLMRDWTGTAELAGVSARINAALAQAFPERSATSLVFAGCGAGGVLTQIDPAFARVLGFDLTLPVLLAARRLLDGNDLELALPHCINAAGHITLHGRERRTGGSAIDLAAMDAFDMAFAPGSLDCVVTAFLVDLLPDPRLLAREVHRVLRSDGVWINYGPSGPLKALWRFDGTEASDFVEEFGFTVTASEHYRTTYLDLSRDCPAWSFQNHVCYLTCARKTGQATTKTAGAGLPDAAALAAAVPQHFPGAQLIERRGFGREAKRSTLLRHEGVPGRPQSIEVGSDAARLLAYVDGTRSVGEIAELLAGESASQSVDETLRAFAHYFSQGVLGWRSR